MNHLTHIEPLEDRIAPATIINPYTVTFQDTDGDAAIVKISKPLFKNAVAAGNILIFTTNDGSAETFGGNSVGESLSEINLLGRTGAQGMNISVKVIPQVGVGNGQVDVGNIAAANFSVSDQVSQGIDLGSVYIQGNLGQITAGAAGYFFTPAVKSLTVLSMNQGLQSDVLGPIGKLNVLGDFNADLNVINYQFGIIGKLNIGGSLTGDAAGDNGTGVIEFTGHIGSATIGNITGTSANETGVLTGTSANPSRIGSLHVLGSITGGAGEDSGAVFAESSIGKVTVDGSVTGGSGQNSGEIIGPLGKVNIQGGLTGGSGTSSGTLIGETVSTLGTAVPVAIGTVTIGGDLTGGTAGVTETSSTAPTAGDSGIISAAGAKSITIEGSLIGGSAGDTNGVIVANSVNSLTIGQSITGGSASDSGIITGQSGVLTMKYGSIVVNGDVTGGTGPASGAILIDGAIGGTIANLRIGGDVVGGTADTTGEIFSTGALTTGVIKGSLIGNTAIGSTTAVVASGYIQAGDIGTLVIQGNVTSGSNSGGEIANSGAIRSAGNILSLTIQGAVTGTAANPVFISAAQGPGKSAKPKTDVAIGSVTIGQAAAYLDLLAGYGPTVSTATDPAGAPLGTPVDGSAQIGAVTFKSTLSASNVVAGVEPDSNGQFGTMGDAAIPAKLGDLQSFIASIIVGGQATGDSTPTDSFGFVAEKLQTVEVDGTAIPTDHLTVGTPEAVNGTNLFLLEVS